MKNKELLESIKNAPATETRSMIPKRGEVSVRDRMQKSAAAIANRVALCAAGEIEMTKEQLHASEMILKRTVPSLQTMDVNVNDSKPMLSEDEARQRLALWIASNPALAALLEAKSVVDVDPQG